MSANRNDVIGFEPTLSKINIKNSNVGRPRKNPDSVYADKIYDTKKIRKYLRDMQITRANQVWSTDITYIKTPKGFVYLVAIIDWYSKAVLSYKISNTMDSELVTDV